MTTPFSTRILSLTVAAVAASAACASSSSPGGGVGTPDASTADAASAAVNGCAAADFAASDHTAANDARAISFPSSGAPMQYSPHCMTVKVGQSVTWSGNFLAHPLEAVGGDAGNPIMLTSSSGGSMSVTFPAAGTFGFDCANHPTLMLGAVRVTP